MKHSDSELKELFRLYLHRMGDPLVDPIEQTESLLQEIQSEGLERLRSLLPEHSGNINRLMLEETKFNWYIQDPEFCMQAMEQRKQSIESIRVQMRRIVEDMLR
jgi:hypothetical protein